MSDNIKVVVKVRPLISREIEAKLSYQWRVNNNTISQIHSNERDCGHSFTFDKIYDKDTKTFAVYNDVAKPIVEAALAGFNGTIFAYGQTSSGKTYTMTGTEDALGIIPLAVHNLFQLIKDIPDREFLVRVSYVEIYNESLIDLLDIKKSIKICESHNGVKVDATERMTTSPEEILEVMKEGQVNRQTGSTNMNEESSRSHSIFQITIESREHIEGEQEAGSVNVSQLNLVDLAGSERSGQTGATGIRFKEGTHINKSLSALALVIKQLSEDPNKHANYRDSKLTRILQNSLGGNAKTSIICAVTPAAVEETISTLQFASRAKVIKNSPAVNIVATDVTMIQNLTKQLSTLKTQLEGKKSVEKDNHKLQNKIAQLQSFILNGFVQRSNADILCGVKRKLNPPRRVTISTLHPIEEDPLPSIPKFCTPSLKYNPVTIPGVFKFVPIPETASLSGVTEESRLVTPPPHDKKVNFNAEIIEIDSDEDNSLNAQLCSPYHKCYESSETPPCVLRKNAKLAEKNLRDIVELTEREKIFMPNVVELMENLENKVAIIAKLEEEVNTLSTMSLEKDLELNKLKSHIEKVEQEFSNITSEKENLEVRIKDYETKLTDSEVSYESLKYKAKIREEELLSLICEHSTKKTYETIAINTSIGDLDNVEQNKSLSMDVQAQLLIKDQSISDLQKCLTNQQNMIITLENANKEFQEMLETHKHDVAIIKKENSFHISTIENLNGLINEQKSFIDSINTDSESYNSVIQELQIKLSEKDKMLKQLITDIDVDNMLASEEIIIANNDNLKNIIHSLKINIQNKKEEMAKIKNKLEETFGINNDDIQKELEKSREQIASLTEETANLKLKYNDNDFDISTVLEEKQNLIFIEQDLNRKLLEIQDEKNTLHHQNEACHLEISKLKECNDVLNKKIAATEEDTKCMEHQIELSNAKIILLESDVTDKIKQIDYLEEQNIKTQIHLEKINVFIKRLQEIASLVSGNSKNIPVIMDDLDLAFTTFSNNLDSLEKSAAELVTQRKDMLTLIENRESEIDNLNFTINNYKKIINEFCSECEIILEMNRFVENSDKEITMLLNHEIENGCDNMKHNLGNLIGLIKITKTHMSEQLKEKNCEIKELLSAIKNGESQVDEITMQVKKRDQYLENVLQKCSELASGYSIENSVSCQFDTGPENTFEKIVLTLDKISNYINILKTDRINEPDDIGDTIADAKKEILHLTDENLKLLNNIYSLENEKASLSKVLKEIHNTKADFLLDLKKCHNLLHVLKYDVVTNAKEFKHDFNNLTSSINEYMQQMEIGKSDLFNKLSHLQSQTDVSFSKLNVTVDNLNYNSNDQNLLTQLQSPPSLLTICCNTIIEAIEPDTNEKSINESSSLHSTTLEDVCQCEQLLAEIESLKLENNYLKNKNESLRLENDNWTREQEIIQKEVGLLLETSYELQKKVVNHRTHLSTLTATTYAENKSLTSQIKFLQHYHNRFYNVCQKDIPDFKKQLQDLLILLRSENFTRYYDYFKQYSLPNTLDSTSMHSTFRNESILDGDLLMLDTNLSLTTCDNTLLGPNQTGLEVTQVDVCKEVACQTNDTEINSFNILHPQVEIDISTHKIVETLQSLKDENQKLRDLVDEYTSSKTSKNVSDDFTSIEGQCINDSNSQECIHIQQLRTTEEEYIQKYNTLSEKLFELESQKSAVLKTSEERNCSMQKNNFDIPDADAVFRKLNAFEKEIQTKQNNIDKLSNSLNQTKIEMQKLQTENDDLSNQVMDYVSELDHLKEEHEALINLKTDLENKCCKLEKDISLHSSDNSDKQITCSDCKIKDHVISDLRERLTSDTCTRLNRSYSDSESSSRYNKLCTLQSELHAGKEDCMELKENVTTIKNHLEGSPNHQAMDIDITLEEPEYALNEDLTAISKIINKNDISEITEEYQLDNYNLERISCFNYYLEKCKGVDSIPDSNMKIVDVMKLLYDNLFIKHSNELENLRNCLKDFEEAKQFIESEVNDLKLEKEKIKEDIKDKDGYLQTMAEVVLNLKNNLTLIQDDCNKSDMILNFKEKFLQKIDSEFGLNGSTVFEMLLNIIKNEHNKVIEEKELEKSKLFEDTQSIKEELLKANDKLSSLNTALNAKENEYNLLCQQKEKIQEVSTAVTLDLIRKDQELTETVKCIYKDVSEANLLGDKEIDFNLSLNDIIKQLFEYIFRNYKESKDIDKLTLEKNNISESLHNVTMLLSEKEKELQRILVTSGQQIDQLKSDLQETLQQKTNFQNIYEKQLEQNTNNFNIAEKLTKEVNMLKENILDKEAKIKDLESVLAYQTKENNLENQSKLSEVLLHLKQAHENIEELKAANEIISKEKETLDKELEDAGRTIAQNKIDLEKVNTDIMILRETVKENSYIVEQLKSETKVLLKDKTELINKLEAKCNECSQLQINIKTHEKTAEIQSKMIIKIRKQKEDAERASCEKGAQVEELNAKCKQLQDHCEKLSNEVDIARDDISCLKSSKDFLETRVIDLEAQLGEGKCRMSIGSIADTSRRRRQSIQDSKRPCSDIQDERLLEAMFKPHTPTEDMFMDVEYHSSNGSTPRRSSRGRDSISSRPDQCERGEKHSLAGGARSRRRSTHDLRRELPPESPIQNGSRESAYNSTSIDGELQELRKRLAACEGELAELKERYRELDDECETCAEYLREKGEQCDKLKKEKVQLETMVKELNHKLLNVQPLEKPKVMDAHVNTDEDWTNLHSVIVDRMSYDAEVDKNKKLMKTIEELRYNKQHLKATIDKMQKALDKNSSRDSKKLEATKHELESCKKELAEYKERCRELDEECETCAEYLRERDEQCRKLKEAKVALENKLQEYEDASVSQSVRKKRQSLHDKRREGVAFADVATDTGDDFISYQVERDNVSQSTSNESHLKNYEHLKMVVQRLSQQKAALEEQLVAFSASPVFVATGSAIVQNQQITDVMKENQKLKKMNAKLINMCKKRVKAGGDCNRENEDPSDVIN